MGFTDGAGAEHGSGHFVIGAKCREPRIFSKRSLNPFRLSLSVSPMNDAVPRMNTRAGVNVHLGWIFGHPACSLGHAGGTK
jgi:hypothetical protein